MSTFRNLKIWEKAMELVTNTYSLTQNLPKTEMYGLVSQIRRASVSIPSNIAEGYGRKGRKDYYRFLNIAISSLFELQTQFEISKNLNYIKEEEFNLIYKSTRELEIMLVTYTRKVERSIQNTVNKKSKI